MILAGASAYPRKIDFAKFREIADAVGMSQKGVNKRKTRLLEQLREQLKDFY